MVKYKKVLRRWTHGVDDAIVVFHKQQCPYCKVAIQHLKTLGRPLVLVDVEGDVAYARCKRDMQRATGHMTYPRVFQAGVFVGGSEEALKMR